MGHAAIATGKPLPREAARHVDETETVSHKTSIGIRLIDALQARSKR